MKIIGHRGASIAAPENTLQSFGKALRLGVDGIELDIQLTKDRVPVVIHDADLERTTNGRGPVSNILFDRLQELDAGKGERVPSLSQVLDLVGGRTRIYVELKEGARGNELAVLQSVMDAGSMGNVTFISFNHASVDKIRVLGLDCEFGYTYGRRVPRLDSINGIGAILPKHTIIGRRKVSDAHRRGIEVIAWTVDDVEEAKRLARIGVDGIITNDPERMINALRQ